MSNETQEREGPILYTAPMVRAILAGRKTQTRRIMKPRLHADTARVMFSGGEWRTYTEDAYPFGDPIRCPYGKPGDRLWVRETWKTGKYLDQDSPRSIAKQCEEAGYSTRGGAACPILYLADEHHRKWSEHDIEDFGPWGKTRVSIHMPRWASRITLEITDLRVERLNAITEDDAIAEGCQCAGVPASLSNVGAFAKLWESINGSGSWESNPWVWVVGFKMVKEPSVGKEA